MFRKRTNDKHKSNEWDEPPEKATGAENKSKTKQAKPVSTTVTTSGKSSLKPTHNTSKPTHNTSKPTQQGGASIENGNGGNSGNGEGVRGPAERTNELLRRTREMISAKTPDPGSDKERLKQKPYYADDAMIKMINLLYDPMTATLCTNAGIADEAQLLSLSLITNSREAWYWADQIARESFLSPCRTWSISKIRRVAFLLARRSLPGKMGSAFAMGVGLAQEQNITKTEEAGEEDNW